MYAFIAHSHTILDYLNFLWIEKELTGVVGGEDPYSFPSPTPSLPTRYPHFNLYKYIQTDKNIDILADTDTIVISLYGPLEAYHGSQFKKHCLKHTYAVQTSNDSTTIHGGCHLLTLH